MRAALGLACALLYASCFSPRYHDGDLQCTPQRACPDGYHCADDNTCWSNGHAPQVDAALVSSDGGVGAGVGLDQLAAEYARVVCSKDFVCCAQSDLRGKNLASCEQNVANLFQILVQAISDGVDRGRTVYAPDRASTCLQTIADIACQDWPVADPVAWLPAICKDTIAAQVGPGGACRSPVECTTGLCSGASSNADGTCLPKASSGETCAAMVGQNSCNDELFCDSTNVCTMTKPEGAACTQNRECKSQSCTSESDAGSTCVAPACYSNGPLVLPACSIGGRPSAFAASALIAVLACLFYRGSRRKRP